MCEVKVMDRKSVRDGGRFPGEVEIFFTTKHNINFHIRWSASSKKKKLTSTLTWKKIPNFYMAVSSDEFSSRGVFLGSLKKHRAENKTRTIPCSLLTRTTFPQPRGSIHRSAAPFLAFQLRLSSALLFVIKVLTKMWICRICHETTQS